MSRYLLVSVCLLHACANPVTAAASTPMVDPAPVAVELPADPAQEGLVEMEEFCGYHEGPIAIDIRVRSGESLDHFARWTESTVETLAALNDIDVRERLYPGQALLLPIDESELDALEGARVADAEARLARYITKRGGLAGVAAHQVKTGETGWQIARREASVPLWVLAAFNTRIDLDELKSGDTIYLPVMGETLGQRFDAQAEASVESMADKNEDK